MRRKLNELRDYPIPSENKLKSRAETDYAGVAIPFQLATESGILSFLSTTTVFGTPVDITLSELAMESFFPADAADLMGPPLTQFLRITTLD